MNTTVADKILSKEAGFLTNALRGGARFAANTGWSGLKGMGRTAAGMGKTIARHPNITAGVAFMAGPQILEAGQNAYGLAKDKASEWWNGKPNYSNAPRPKSNGGPLDMAYNFFGTNQGKGAGIGALSGAVLGSQLGLPWWAGGLLGGGLGYLGGSYMGR